jgi:hypothetical protein
VTIQPKTIDLCPGDNDTVSSNPPAPGPPVPEPEGTEITLQVIAEVPAFFISIPPDEEPLQSVLPLQLQINSTLHGTVCANAKAGNKIPATMRHIHAMTKPYVFPVFMCHPPVLVLNSIIYFFYFKKEIPQSAHKLIEVYFTLLYYHSYGYVRTLVFPFFIINIIRLVTGLVNCNLGKHTLTYQGINDNF